MFSGWFRKSPGPSGELATDSDPSTSNDSLSDSTKRETQDNFQEKPCHQDEPSPFDPEEDNENLLDWWRTVEGWDEWNEALKVQKNEDSVVEQAADRIYMAAQLFVSLLDQRSKSLEARVAELRSVADGTDSFHKRTVAASVGGSAASVAGSVTTITGLILAPFTFGTSLIVTGVGIGVATAGGLTSASANITDAVHSKMDRKKVEKMIQDYQEEMEDIKECLEFVQEGMDVLQKWNFEEYKHSLSKQALNRNVKHVIKEGGRAGKALLINTENLVSTVQVFSVAGGAARAAQAISVTTGVMSALFLTLDVFFLAKNSHELHAGAKTKFAAKIREVCSELDEGLLELNKIKAQLQKTMAGEELEEGKEEEETLECSATEMVILEQELDQLEDELDHRAQKKQDKSSFVGNEKVEKLSSRDVDLWEREANVAMKRAAEIQDNMVNESAKCEISDMQTVTVKNSLPAVEKQEMVLAGRPRANAFLYIPNDTQQEERACTEDQQPLSDPRKLLV